MLKKPGASYKTLNTKLTVLLFLFIISESQSITLTIIQLKIFILFSSAAKGMCWVQSHHPQNKLPFLKEYKKKIHFVRSHFNFFSTIEKF